MSVECLCIVIFVSVINITLSVSVAPLVCLFFSKNSRTMKEIKEMKIYRQ